MIKKTISEIKNKRTILLKFIIVGFIGFLTNYSFFAALAYYIGFSKQLSELLAIGTAVHITFLMNNIWTYRQNSRGKLINRYFKYMTSNVVGSLITYTVFILFIYIFHHSKLNDLLALIISSGAGMLWNYILNTYVIWSERNI